MKSIRVLMPTLAALLCACSAPQLEIKRAETVKPGEHPERPLFEWQDTGGPGAVSIAISLAEQKARIYRAGEQIGWTYVATGKPSHPSPRGSFRIMEKIVDKHSNKYGMIVDGAGDIVDSDAAAGREGIPKGGRFMGAPMPYWMRITSWGVGMHAGPIPDPGFPASHGCIRLPLEMAKTLFGVVTVGTPVTIQ